MIKKAFETWLNRRFKMTFSIPRTGFSANLYQSDIRRMEAAYRAGWAAHKRHMEKQT